MPGVRAIYHRKNIGKIFRATPELSFGEEMSYVDENRPAFEDDVIRYWGQYVALAVADTFEQAKAAADAVKVDLPAGETERQSESDPREAGTAESRPSRGRSRTLNPRPKSASIESERGDPEKAFAEAPVQVDFTYHLPVETHNPIELHCDRRRMGRAERDDL